MALLNGQVDNRQPLLLGVFHRIRGTSGALGQITNTIAAVIPTLNLDADYQRLKAAGVDFLNEPQTIEAWGMRCTYFRDPEGNLFELNDGDI